MFDCESGLAVLSSILIAIEETTERTFFLSLFSVFGYKDGLSPKIHKVVLSFGRVEQ